MCVCVGAKEGRHQQKQRRGVIPRLLVFATRVCGVDSGGAQTGVISGSHRAPLITIPMFLRCTERQENRQTGGQISLPTEGKSDVFACARETESRSERKSRCVDTESFPGFCGVHCTNSYVFRLLSGANHSTVTFVLSYTFHIDDPVH